MEGGKGGRKARGRGKLGYIGECNEKEDAQERRKVGGREGGSGGRNKREEGKENMKERVRKEKVREED